MFFDDFFAFFCYSKNERKKPSNIIKYTIYLMILYWFIRLLIPGCLSVDVCLCVSFSVVWFAVPYSVRSVLCAFASHSFSILIISQIIILRFLSKQASKQTGKQFKHNQTFQVARSLNQVVRVCACQCVCVSLSTM